MVAPAVIIPHAIRVRNSSSCVPACHCEPLSRIEFLWDFEEGLEQISPRDKPLAQTQSIVSDLISFEPSY